MDVNEEDEAARDDTPLFGPNRPTLYRMPGVGRGLVSIPLPGSIPVPCYPTPAIGLHQRDDSVDELSRFLSAPSGHSLEGMPELEAIPDDVPDDALQGDGSSLELPVPGAPAPGAARPVAC